MFNLIKIISFSFFILVSSINLYALSIIDISKTKKISILNLTDVYFSDKNLTKNELIKNHYLKPYYKLTINNAQSGRTVWIRFKVKNSSNKSIQRALIFTSPSLEFISLYKGKNNQGEANGISVKKKHFTIHYAYTITLQPHSSQEYIISVFSSHKSFLFQLILQDYEEFRQEDLLKQAPRILMLGLLFGLMIYSFLLAFYSKDISYFYYASYLFFTLWHQITF